MKILQVSAHFAPNVGGVETHLTDLVSELSKKNHSVFVLTYRPLVSTAKWQVISRSKDITIFRIPWLRGLYYRFEQSSILSFLYLVPGLFFFLPFTILYFRPDVIHAHGIVSGLCAVFWGRLLGVRSVVSTHSLYKFPKTGLYRSLAQFIFKNANAALCLSKQSVQEIVSLGIPNNCIHQFTYWINLEIFKRNKQIRASTRKTYKWVDKHIALFVGRLVPEKGIHELLAAAKLLKNSHKIAVVGTGPLEDVVKKAAKVEKRIQYVGLVPNEKLPAILNGADLLIVPSTHDEGFGRVIIEALACGIPVIGSKRGAIPDIVTRDVGMLIDVSAENIAQAVNTLDAKTLRKMSDAATIYAENHFSPRNVSVIIDSYSPQ